MTRNELFLTLAKSQIGVTEFQSDSNPIIEMYHRFASLKNNEKVDDAIPWCSSFVCYVVEQCGLTSTNSRAARSWLKWGVETVNPKLGDIVVISRGDNSWSGHVGFFYGYNQNGNVLILGGNQADSVNITAFKRDRVLGFRTTQALNVNVNS